MKRNVKIIGVLILLLLFYAFSQYTHEEGPSAEISEMAGEVNLITGDSILIDSSNSFFEFEGYAVGKSHTGTFDDFSGNLFFEDGKIIGAEGIISVGSVNTGIEGLDKHLKNDDFFDVEQYPKITLKSFIIEEDLMNGKIEFRGIEKEISFPVVINEAGLSADFFLDVTPFNFENTGVNKDVRIAFEFKATEGI